MFIDAPVASFEFSYNRIVYFRIRTWWRTGWIWLRLFVQEQAVYVLMGSAGFFSVCRPSCIRSFCRRPDCAANRQTSRLFFHYRGTEVDRCACPISSVATDSAYHRPLMHHNYFVFLLPSLFSACFVALKEVNSLKAPFAIGAFLSLLFY